MKAALFSDENLASRAVRAKEVDIAVVGDDRSGITHLYLLGPNAQVPESLKKLPGFRSVGVSGIPADPVWNYRCHRTPAEVLTALTPA